MTKEAAIIHASRRIKSRNPKPAAIYRNVMGWFTTSLDYRTINERLGPVYEYELIWRGLEIETEIEVIEL